MYPKILRSINNDEIIVRLYNPKTDYDRVLNVLRESYMKESNTFRVSGMNEPEAFEDRLEYEKYIKHVLNEGVSLVAHHLSSDRIAGICINTIQSRPEPGHLSSYEEFRDTIRSTKLKNLLDCFKSTDKKLNLFEKFNTDYIFEFTCLTTQPDFRRKGIGQNLVECSVDIARTVATVVGSGINGLKRKSLNLVFSVFSSIYSAKIGENLGFIVIQSTSLNALEINGTPLFSKTPYEHLNMVSTVLQI